MKVLISWGTKDNFDAGRCKLLKIFLVRKISKCFAVDWDSPTCPVFPIKV